MSHIGCGEADRNRGVGEWQARAALAEGGCQAAWGMGHVLLRQLRGVDTPSLFQVWGGRKNLDLRERPTWASISQCDLGRRDPARYRISIAD